MTGNHTMDHHVWPWHLYSCDGTFTHSSLCRIPPSLVASHICYLLDHASLMRCQLSWLYSSILPYIFIHYGDLIHCILYVVMTTHGICISFLFMAIVLLCISDCYMYICSHMMRFIIVFVGHHFDLFLPLRYPSFPFIKPSFWLEKL